MSHDSSILRWKLESILGFANTFLKLETIQNSSGRYQSAIFETGSSGNLVNLGIKFSEYFSSKEDAIKRHNQIEANLIEIQKNEYSNIEEVYSDIEKYNIIAIHEGPRYVEFVKVLSGNMIVGREDEMEKKQVTPLDLLKTDRYLQDQSIVDSRMNICKECPELTRSTRQCKQCKCFMYAKTKLSEASCPLGKW